ncbi:hypothetical protein Pint_11804 [Pistacia integerrima]|uniref:Uncharacterized protein n=1 Tax=Pistacia integerrima TaxID=434235 RepID=A0ACC0XGP3_9ROSI|nr:hypothetical protein Pint_11804 [Pistacia integerrima]
MRNPVRENLYMREDNLELIFNFFCGIIFRFLTLLYSVRYRGGGG